MYNTHPYRKIALALTGVIIGLLVIIALLIANQTSTTPEVTAVPPPPYAEIAQAPAACNTLLNALGGCK